MVGSRVTRTLALFTCLVACLFVLCSRQKADVFPAGRRLISIAEQLGATDLASLASDAVQELLWDRNHIAAVGEEAFLQWMLNGGVPVSRRGKDLLPQELKPKLILRVLAFCKDVLPEQIIASYAEDLAEVEGIDFGKIRPLMSGEAVVKSRVHEEFRLHGHPDKSSPFNYFSFMPRFIGRAQPGQGPLSFQSRCWKTVTVECTAKSSSGWQLKVHASGHLKLFCSETFVFFSTSHVHAVSFTTPLALPSTMTFKSDGLSESEVWDVETFGIRLFALPVSLLEAVHNLFVTALLFTPENSKGVPKKGAARNIEFLKHYVGYDMAPREDSVDPLNESSIHSGDMFGIMRLDGLDPMLAWGMGSGTGHTTVALWEGGKLYVAESTINSTYWPTNGIQRTPYRQWLKQAREAGYQTVHLPLTKKYREQFDVQQANAFFHSNDGLQYGYQALLTGWIDTERNNYPCKPPYDGPAAEKQCLVWETLEVGVPIVTRMIPSFEHPFIPAWNTHVTGSASSALTATELYREMHNKGRSLASIPAMPESDEHLYPSVFNNGTKGPGLAMVCDVFVCRIWKAGGLFKEIGDDFSCVEQTNLDVYALDVVEADASTVPACKRDPGNPLCQLTGDYVLKLPKAAKRHMYKHMQETCPTEPPLYARSDTC
mmetsp:Transcript_35616/g.81625  ORF Transcript_35616/g.81625 Transcript_35616/m.81625 type:complete len:657 (-) Transcript_35616:66-2036(-)